MEQQLWARRLYLALVTGLFIFLSASCSENGSGSGNLNAGEGNGSGFGNTTTGGGGTAGVGGSTIPNPSNLGGSTLPGLNSGTATSEEEAVASGTSPGNAKDPDYNQIASEWQKLWSSLFGPFDPRTLPPEVLAYLAAIYCDSGYTYNLAYAFLMGLYLDDLYRFANPAEVQAWMQHLNVYSQQSRWSMAMNILGSDDASNIFAQNACYGFLDRECKANEVGQYKQIVAGYQGTIERLYAKVLGSNEYYTTKGRSDNRRFVQEAIKDVFGREPQGWEVNYYTTTSGNLKRVASREELATQLVTSDENYLKFIVNSYLVYFGRFPTGQELQGRLQQMRQGYDMKKMMALLQSDPEYVNRQPKRFGFVTEYDCKALEQQFGAALNGSK